MYFLASHRTLLEERGSEKIYHFYYSIDYIIMETD